MIYDLRLMICRSRPLKRFLLPRNENTDPRAGANERKSNLFYPRARWTTKSTCRVGRSPATPFHAQRTDQVHVEDLDAAVAKCDHHGGLVRREQHLYGMIHINRL